MVFLLAVFKYLNKLRMHKLLKLLFSECLIKKVYLTINYYENSSEMNNLNNLSDLIVIIRMFNKIINDLMSLFNLFNIPNSNLIILINSNPLIHHGKKSNFINTIF